MHDAGSSSEFGAGFDAHLTKPAGGAALAAILASRASSSGQEGVEAARPL